MSDEKKVEKKEEKKGLVGKIINGVKDFGHKEITFTPGGVLKKAAEVVVIGCVAVGGTLAVIGRSVDSNDDADTGTDSDETETVDGVAEDDNE